MNLSSFLTGDFCHLSMRGEISVTPSPLRGRNLLPPHKIKGSIIYFGALK